MDYNYGLVGYVSESGEYGVDYTITFNYSEFYKTYPKAWKHIDTIYKRSRPMFIMAVIDQNLGELADFSVEYEIPMEDLVITKENN
jgi:hypothetical protein